VLQICCLNTEIEIGPSLIHTHTDTHTHTHTHTHEHNSDGHCDMI